MKEFKNQSQVVINGLAFALVVIKDAMSDGQSIAHAEPHGVSNDKSLENNLTNGECIDVEGRHYTIMLDGDELDLIPEHGAGGIVSQEPAIPPAIPEPLAAAV